jgi:hypothetical protein
VNTISTLHAIFQSEFLDYLKLINLADPVLETAVDKQILDSAYIDSLLPVYESIAKTLQS